MLGVSVKDYVTTHYGIKTERRVVLVLHLKDSKPVEVMGVKDSLFAKSLIEMAVKNHGVQDRFEVK